MARSFSKKKLTPCVAHIERLKGKIAEPRSRDSGNTILQKDFAGGSWMLTGSNSGASFRQESIKYLILDDFDEFETDIDGQGDPQELADRRTGTFACRKIYINSTTTNKDTSNILRAFEASSQGYFHVPCPHCEAYQYFEWGGKDAEWGIKFKIDEDKQVTEAWYICKLCHARIEETAKPWMLERGKYFHRYPQRKVRGFKWNALYTPIGWVNSWAYIAQKFIEASHELKQGSVEKYKTWLNSFMSEAWEDKGEQPDWVKLKARCEPYQPLTAPAGVKIITAGVDVHPNRLICSIYGWGAGEECWLIYHTEIAGDVNSSNTWGQLDLLCNRQYQSETGVMLQVLSIAVDSGDGNTTQAVRHYCRVRAPRYIAIKGMSQPAKPVIGIPSKQDLTWDGEKIEDGIEIWPVGSDTAKSTLYARLNIEEPGPGRIHFYLGIEDEFFKQLTAEKLVTRFVKGYPVREWNNVRPNKRNESLDCWNYSYAAAIRVGLAYMNMQAIHGGKQAPEHRRPRPQNQRKKREWARW